ncbi:MAG: PIG-L family deacetylase, partial [Candidatus Bipolaricaulota bacterium]|nr:PIG-L family deacetylase [Candidatus Bipolaricaulota bacterium]
MRWIYISPHFDDAVLSCGGLIWVQTQNGIPVEIWTVCAGDAPPGPLSPKAVECHQQWGIESAKDVVAARRLENQEAASLVGAETVNFSIADCIYRRSPTGEMLYPEDVFVPIHPVEQNLYVEIVAALASELQPDDMVVSPLAIGGHLDHVLTRLAAERLDHPLYYYADIPYLINHPEMLVPASRGLRGTLYPISEKGLASWQSGVAAYATQIPLLFETEEKMQEAIRVYWENQRGIRMW